MNEDLVDPEMDRIERLTDEELDAELRSYGYDPGSNWKMYFVFLFMLLFLYVLTLA